MLTSRRAVIAAGAAIVVVGLGVFALTQLGGGEAEPFQAPTGRVVQPGAPGQSPRTLSPDEVNRISAPPHNLADTLFFQQMIPHHAQALEMTALVNQRTTNNDIRLLAERITVSQKDEIAQMQVWLTDRGEKPPTPHANHAGHDTLMPGMLNDQQLAQLAAASGTGFDRMFVELMIYHHEGALTMVQRLYSNGGGLEPSSDRFAREVNADQHIEILRMRDILAKLNG